MVRSLHFVLSLVFLCILTLSASYIALREIITEVSADTLYGSMLYSPGFCCKIFAKLLVLALPKSLRDLHAIKLI